MITTAPERSAVAAAIPALICTPGMSYVEFHSELIGAGVRVGYEFHGETLSYQFGNVGPSIELIEVWLGGADIGIHLTESSASILSDEAENAILWGAL